MVKFSLIICCVTDYKWLNFFATISFSMLDRICRPLNYVFTADVLELKVFSGIQISLEVSVRL